MRVKQEIVFQYAKLCLTAVTKCSYCTQINVELERAEDEDKIGCCFILIVLPLIGMPW